MDSKVKVVADATTQLVINQSANPVFGYVRVVQNRIVIDDNGFMKRKEFSALIHGLVEDLQSAGYYDGMELPGTIIAEESLDPFNKKDPSKSIKKAGDTNVACTLGGFPIHRRTKYTTKSGAEDILIAHDNKAEVKAAYANGNKIATMQPNAEFDSQAEDFNL